MQIDREKNRMKDKSDKKQGESVGPLLCIGVDSKIDRLTLMYIEVTSEDGEIKLKKGKGSEHHLTFTFSKKVMRYFVTGYFHHCPSHI